MKNLRFEVVNLENNKKKRLEELDLEAFCPVCYGSNVRLFMRDSDSDGTCNEYICGDCGCDFRFYVSKFAGFKTKFGLLLIAICLILGLILLVSFVILVDFEVMNGCLALVFMGLIAILIIVMWIFW